MRYSPAIPREACKPQNPAQGSKGTSIEWQTQIWRASRKGLLTRAELDSFTKSLCLKLRVEIFKVMKKLVRRLASGTTERFRMTGDTELQHDLIEAVDRLQTSGLIDTDWYLKEYRDVRWMDIDPAIHFLKYGILMGRRPAPYIEIPEEIRRRLRSNQPRPSAVVDAIIAHRGVPYRPRTEAEAWDMAEARVNRIAHKLHRLGLEQDALAELTALSNDTEHPHLAVEARRELAMWNVCSGTQAGAQRALDILRQKPKDPILPVSLIEETAVIALTAHWLAGDTNGGRAAYSEAAKAGGARADLLLSVSSHQSDEVAKLDWINAALQVYNLPGVSLLPNSDAPVFDRLVSMQTLPPREGGPKVTVLVAAHNASRMIDTALRGLVAQTWRNLEIIVIDDRSEDDTVDIVRAAIEQDDRIRLIALTENVGAYEARNRGLIEATGSLITLHDADDWSHPIKIESQVGYLADNPAVLGCTSEQARATNELDFVHLKGRGRLIGPNTSSLIFRRDPVIAALGAWDRVRFGADSELINRMQTVFGMGSFAHIPSGPMSFMRSSEASITNEPVRGVSVRGFFGARREYHAAQTAHHMATQDLNYAGLAERPFPIPPVMRLASDRPPEAFDLIVEGDFRSMSEDLKRFLAELPRLRKRYDRIGFVERYEYDGDAELTDEICRDLRNEVDGDQCRVLVYGDTVIAKERLVLSGAFSKSIYTSEIRSPVQR